MLALGQRGRTLIRSFEELRLKAYRNFVGEPWTCGWGHTGKDVGPSTICTPEQADLWFECDIARPERAVNLMAKPPIPLNQNEFDALVSFAYNLGVGAEAHSTLMKLVNASDFDGAAAEFLKWDHENGVVVPGLTRRRTAERDLFISTEGL